MCKTIIIFAPHPDDEVIACGGTILKKIKEKFNVKIVFVTDGSHSHLAILNIKEAPSPDELIGIRKIEAINSAKKLGVNRNNVYFLGAIDTQLKKSDIEVRGKINNILSNEDNLLEIYLPHRIELHSDHSITNIIVTSLVSKMEIDATLYQYIVWDEEMEKHLNFSLRESPEKNRNTNLGEKIEIDISEFVQKKIQALREHRSQTELISPHQTKAILPSSFIKKMASTNIETFWIYR